MTAHEWSIIAAVAFSSANIPEAVPAVFQFILNEIVLAQEAASIPEEKAHEEQLGFARKFREAVLQSGLLSGMPRVSTSLYRLIHVCFELESELL